MLDVPHLKKLIAKDCLLETMDAILVDTSNSNNYNEAILLSLKLTTFRKAKIQGRFSWEEENRIKATLANQILQFLDFMGRSNL